MRPDPTIETSDKKETAKIADTEPNTPKNLDGPAFEALIEGKIKAGLADGKNLGRLVGGFVQYYRTEWQRKIIVRLAKKHKDRGSTTQKVE